MPSGAVRAGSVSGVGRHEVCESSRPAFRANRQVVELAGAYRRRAGGPVYDVGPRLVGARRTQARTARREQASGRVRLRATLFPPETGTRRRTGAASATRSSTRRPRSRPSCAKRAPDFAWWRQEVLGTEDRSRGYDRACSAGLPPRTDGRGRQAALNAQGLVDAKVGTFIEDFGGCRGVRRSLAHTRGDWSVAWRASPSSGFNPNLRVGVSSMC